MGISIYKQLKQIDQTYENWSGKINFRKLLVVYGKVQPTAVSPEYDVRITYWQNKPPIIEVLSPKLKIRDGKKSLPHVYHSDQLCLYYKDFNIRTDLLADSIIVWITWWLYYYEIWYETGKWVARGTHPSRW